MRIRRMTAPPDLREFDDDRIARCAEKESRSTGRTSKAARCATTRTACSAPKPRRETSGATVTWTSSPRSTRELIAEVLASTGIPVFKLTEEESAGCSTWRTNCTKRIIGMDDAIKALSQAIRRTRAGLKDPRPRWLVHLRRAHGVGKTEPAKALAEFLFGDEDALIQLDMSEFSEKHTVSRLFGSPPGYVGYEEGGQLTEKVRRRRSPSSLRRGRKGPPGDLQLAVAGPRGRPPDRLRRAGWSTSRTPSSS